MVQIVNVSLGESRYKQTHNVKQRYLVGESTSYD